MALSASFGLIRNIVCGSGFGGQVNAPRLASRIGEAQARVAAMLLLTLRGTPTLYYGDELGMQNGIITRDHLQDPQGIRLGAERSRDISRTPMQWDGSPNAGFSSSPPWLPISDNYQEFNLAVQSRKSDSLLNLYRNLIWFRKKTPALRGGSYRSVEVNNVHCYAYIREHQKQAFLIALNFSERPQTLNIDEGDRGSIIFSTFLDREEPIPLSHLHLRPNEGLLIELPL